MAAQLISDRPERAIAVYAHPDDSDISCGGTLARWASGGSEVHVVICAVGDKGAADPKTDVRGLVAERSAELSASAEVLGLSGLHQLDHRDGELENDLVLRRELVGLIRALRPEVLVCPDPLAVFFGEHYYNHRDHRVVGWAALDAAAPAAASALYFPEAGPPVALATALLSGSLEPNVVVDVTETIDTKADAVCCHHSQLGSSPEWIRSVVRERAEEAGRLVGVAHGEAFRRVQLSS